MDTVIASGHQKRGDLQADWFVGPFGVLAEYVRSEQGLELAGTRGNATTTAWTAEAQWVLTGEDSTYDNVKPLHAFDPGKGQWGAFDVVARVNQLRIDGAPFAASFVDPTKSARRATAFGAGLDWFTNQNFRLVLDGERTYFQLGAAAGNRVPENTIVARVQTVF
jgi:phosphate-selective porin OprO/OprP